MKYLIILFGLAFMVGCDDGGISVTGTGHEVNIIEAGEDVKTSPIDNKESTVTNPSPEEVIE
ncbi:MAG: hypothetical protein DRI24_24165 [Deltaproteobacteria bacterium]|nr:MAG: hypothetical protein DRI24_24165 [Deltaproteobacteria bacterium]